MKKRKFDLFASIFQIVISVVGLTLYIYMAFNDAIEKRFLITAIFLIFLLYIGIKGLIDYIKVKPNEK